MRVGNGVSHPHFFASQLASPVHWYLSVDRVGAQQGCTDSGDDIPAIDKSRAAEEQPIFGCDSRMLKDCKRNSWEKHLVIRRKLGL